MRALRRSGLGWSSVLVMDRQNGSFASLCEQVRSASLRRERRRPGAPDLRGFRETGAAHSRARKERLPGRSRYRLLQSGNGRGLRSRNKSRPLHAAAADRRLLRVAGKFQRSDRACAGIPGTPFGSPSVGKLEMPALFGVGETFEEAVIFPVRTILGVSDSLAQVEQ